MNKTISMNNNGGDEENVNNFDIKLDDPAKFETCIETALTTTNNLSNLFNSMLATSFSDYIGCDIIVNGVSDQMNQIRYNLVTQLYFDLLTDAEYKRIEKDGLQVAFNGQNATYDGSVAGYYSRGINRNLRMIPTDYGKALLNKYIYNPEDADNIWAGRESGDPQYRTWTISSVRSPRGESIRSHIKVDTNKLIEKCYGTLKADNFGNVEKYQYSTDVIGPFTQGASLNDGSSYGNMYNSMRARSYVIHINRANVTNLSAAADRIGLRYNYGGSDFEPMYAVKR